ncbi:MAG: hypothetical protein LBS70_03905, partial [Candidatus Accumulibacter sp.]|nr:hypothetical protein [Accumulibacter sp.]
MASKRIGLLAPVLLALLLLCGGGARAGMAVIVNPANQIDRLSKSQVINIFLANSREFPNSVAVSPIDLGADSPENARFYRALVNRGPEQMQAYWSRLVFSGKATPPAKAASWQDVIQAVAANPHAIGYVD